MAQEALIPDRSSRLSRRALLVTTAASAVAMASRSTAGASRGWQETRFAHHVDPFIGTDGTGHTFPGPSRPFGMVQPGPDNVGSGWDFTSGYQYRAPLIAGFSQSRASGTGIPELGDVLLQPVAGPGVAQFASPYDKSGETARPGYYAVTLTGPDVRVELTCTRRVALHRYRFAQPGRVHVLVDLQHGLTFVQGDPVTEASSDLVPDGLTGTNRISNWTTRTVAFRVLFDRPVAEATRLPGRGGEKAARYVLAFDAPDGILQAKVALSTVDVEGATRNMDEQPGWDFDGVVREAEAEWNALLGRIEVEADPATLRTFYTALYHVCLHPSLVSDTDGRYRRPDGEVGRARGQDHYSTLSLWDTFRAAHPLYTLLVPERVDDFVLTLLDHHSAQGYLPIWTIWGGETNTMIGNPALPVIADAWAKGFRGFDGSEALEAMIRTSTVDHAHSQWSVLDRYGYLPFDVVDGEAVSRTLEAGIGDAATGRMATMMGRTEVARQMTARAGLWRNLIDPETRLARGRDAAGGWRTPFEPLKATSPLGNPGDYTEANAWQYSWTPALHDPAGLVEAMGGRAAFTAMLDRFFSLQGEGEMRFLGQEGLIGQYAHGNEPSHHIAWLYAWSDTPWRGPDLVRRIARDFYRDTPDGIFGNEDAGQMSAWYIFATLGFYPVDPSAAAYVLGKPLVRRATVTLAGGRTLTIRTEPAADPGSVPPTVRLNGTQVETVDINHSALVAGGVLEFT